MSNFNKCKIVLPDGTVLHSGEQRYHKATAAHFKDNDAERRIMEAATPLECYHIGQHIKNLKKDEWSAIENKTMKHLVSFKFTHNEDLNSILLSTGNNKLGEAIRNKHR